MMMNELITMIAAMIVAAATVVEEDDILKGHEQCQDDIKAFEVTLRTVHLAVIVGTS